LVVDLEGYSFELLFPWMTRANVIPEAVEKPAEGIILGEE
jgi:hypothetical protein